MLSGPSFRSTFFFSVNSLILSGFPLTSFNLGEASISVFLWIYTLVCEVVQNYFYLFKFLVFIFQLICLFYLHDLKT